MKFKISRPPIDGRNTEEKLERILSWLYSLSEQLNVVLENLTEENFSNDAKEKLFKRKENEDENV